MLVTFLLLINVSVSQANVIYKCRTQSGSVSYSQSPCGPGETTLKSRDLSKKYNKRNRDRYNKKRERRSNRENRRQRNRNNDQANNQNSNSDPIDVSTNTTPTTTTNNTNNTTENNNIEEPHSTTVIPPETEPEVPETTTEPEPEAPETLSEPEPEAPETLTEPEPEAPETLSEPEPETNNNNTGDTTAPPTGGGSPNQTPTEVTTAIGDEYGPIEFEIISWPLTKAYPGIEYNIRVGAIGGQFPYVYRLEQAPSGMTINQNRGDIVWTPDVSLEGTSASVRLSVTDLTGSKIEQSFNISVTKAGIYFVSPNGSDSTGNGSIGNPWKTMDTAITRAGSDGILYLRGGTYRGAFSLSASDCNKWIAFPGESPVLDLNLSTLWPRSNYGYIDGLEIINAQHWGFSFTGQDNWVFRRNHMHHLYDDSFSENPSFIFFWDESAPNNRAHENFIIQDNIFHDLFDRGSGINGDNTADFQGGSSVMYNVYKVLYEDNEAYNIDGFGVKDKDHGQYNTFRGNYLHDNARTAFALSNQYSGNNVDILFNVFVGSVFVGQEPGDLGYVLFRHNTVYGQLMHKDARPYGEENTFIIIDNIISMKQADKNKIIDWADSETHAAHPYLCCNDGDGVRFTSSILYRNKNLINYDTSYIAGWGFGRNRTLSEWQNLGFDVDSIFADPQFNNADERDFRPKSTSPACGAAFDGGDIGALRCMD